MACTGHILLVDPFPASSQLLKSFCRLEETHCGTGGLCRRGINSPFPSPTSLSASPVAYSMYLLGTAALAEWRWKVLGLWGRLALPAANTQGNQLWLCARRTVQWGKSTDTTSFYVEEICIPEFQGANKYKSRQQSIDQGTQKGRGHVQSPSQIT